ncbi:MAG: glycoside hydrolase family 32 protein, partial [Actinomycetes bacterium]|nr:glycoside hydrolase family 32 protein [Actinomycetes bacterium]MDX5381261.1 glycoside hydrolase family 32 protein [Actinomycetes bacterium]MDX5400602.1 glycoside hydrolase family 32 protein [Actinomycetes bacterium]MDX5451034.1 glycoside hydrolase family 32 protein [Actinomycetes bacterium]
MTAAAHTAYHLRPATGGWLNDPNGMTKVGDTWHVFYQHNARGPWHEAISWGHASSRDLATWQHHPIAFSPTPGGPDAFGCWSGCFVPGGERPAVAYSGVVDGTLRSTVCLRQGSPDLETWSEPSVVAETPDADDVAVMRDPFVFEAGGRQWAVLGGGLRGGVPAVLLFNRDDESAWTYEGLFLTGTEPLFATAETADIWECPQLVRMDGRWVLILSLQYQTVLGAVVAVVGDIEFADGRPRFVPERLNVL